MNRPTLTLAEVSHQHKVWIIGPVVRCVQYIGDETLLGAITQRAVAAFENFDTYLGFARKEALRRGRREAVAGIDTLLREHAFHASYIRELRAAGFARLSAHSLVAIWAALESAVEETAVLILMNDSSLRTRMLDEAGAKRYDPSDDDEERCRLLVKLWEQSRPKNERPASVGHRFERLLSFFGLGSPAPLGDTLAAHLAEINAIRNCLMHRRGIVDERAVREAPHLATRLGQPIAIGRADFLRYYKAISDYAVSLMGRVTTSNYCT